MSFSAYSEYKNSGFGLFGKVPNSWSIQRLKQVVSPSRPITYGIVQAGENVPDGIPYIRPADMTDESGVKAEETLLKTSIEIAKSYKRSSILSGDIVCSIGPSFGKLMMVPDSLEGSNLTQGTARVAVSQDHIPRFVFWVLKSVESYQQWESSVGGATFRALNLGPLAETFICVPNRAEQSQIARFLDHETARIDELIEEQQRLIQLLKEKRHAVISHAVTKGLDPAVPMKDSGVEWLGVVPLHWGITQIKRRCDLITDGAHISPDTESGMYCFVSTKDVSDEGIDFERCLRTSAASYEYLVKTGCQPAAGDVLFSKDGTIGKTTVVSGDSPKFVVASSLIIIRPERKGLLPSYLDFLCQSWVISQQVEGFVKGAGLPRLSIQNLTKVVGVFPPFEEQVLIAEFLHLGGVATSELASEAWRTMELLKERRSALISAAVTGKIDVRGWQPPSSVPTPKLVQEAV